MPTRILGLERGGFESPTSIEKGNESGSQRRVD